MRIGDINPLIPAGYDYAWGAIILAVAILTVAGIVSILRSPRLATAGRLLWLVLVLVVPILGALAWFVGGRTARLQRDVR